MTTKKGTILLFAITMIAFMILPVQGDWEVEQIESIYDDGFITETGGSFFETPWVQIKGGSVNLASYFAFRGVTIPDNSTILNAYLEFTAPFPWNYNQTLLGTVYGIKTPDLASWDPTPSLNSEPITTTFTNFDVAPLISGTSINVTITDQVKEIYDLFGWVSNNDMGFTVRTVAISGGARYAEAYDSSPILSASLYVEYTASNATTQYYKGYTISSQTIGTGAVLTYNDYTDGDMKLTTADGVDYKTITASALNLEAPDSAVSVGTDIYMVIQKSVNPWNTSLRRTTDRGDTWTDVGVIKAVPGSAALANIVAIAYDTVDTIYIAYANGFDTYCKIFTISNQTMSNGFMIFDGGYNIHQHRSYWDETNNVIWFTRYGGDAGASSRRPNVIRKYNGSWETYRLELSDYRVNDVTFANGSLYWVIHQYTVTAANNWLRLYQLNDYSDLTNWTQIGGIVGGWDRFNNKMDIGTWTPGSIEYPVVSVERLLASGDTYVYQARWNGATWDTWVYNQTGFFPNPQPDFRSPKMYYQSGGKLMMSLVVIPSGGSALLYNDWEHFQTSESAPGTTVIKSTGHSIDYVGGDMFPYTAGQTQWTVYDENGTLIGTFDTLEEAKVAIDDIEGQTSDDPNPPGTTYPDDGFGELTRFNLRMYIWLIGWVLIFIPPLAMAYKTYPFKFYLVFFIIEVLGWALLWSIASI